VVRMRSTCVAVVAATLFAADATSAATTRLPIFTVSKHGVSSNQGKALQRALGLPGNPRTRTGALRFFDLDLYGKLPTIRVSSDAGADDDGGATFTEAFDFAAIGRLTTVSDKKARTRAASAFKAAGLQLSGRGAVSHGEFNAFNLDGSKIIGRKIDTQVSYPSKLANRPLIGPGSKAKLVLDGSGRVTQLAFNFRSLKQGPAVPLLSTATADKIARAQFGASCAGQAGLQGLRLSRSLVYWAPSLSQRVKQISPHYRYTGSAITDGQRVTLQPLLLPAIRSGGPSVSLSTTTNGATINARSTAKGGRGPYSFRYSSCASTLSPKQSRAGKTTSYPLRSRLGGTTRDTVSVVVTDANGLQAFARRDVTVATAGAVRRPTAFAAIGGRKDVATEWIGDSQGLPNSSQNAYDFRDEMGDISTVQFNWGNNDVFESDFVDPSLGGDDVNWADNVDFLYFQGHGNLAGFFVGKKQGNGFVAYTQVKWGNSPGDMEWIALNTCETLAEGSGNLTLNERWAPRMKGVHTLLGFSTLSYNVDSLGNVLGDDLADNNYKVRSAWVDAANENPSGVVWLFTGPIGAGNVTNYNDYFHGIGPVTKDITSLTGYYYYKGTV
jgi:hypothetical protein